MIDHITTHIFGKTETDANVHHLENVIGASIMSDIDRELLKTLLIIIDDEGCSHRMREAIDIANKQWRERISKGLK